MRICTLALLASMLAAASPGAAQTLCRTDALGSVSCRATPAERWTPFADGRGLTGVQRRPEPEAPVLVPSWRTDAFGNTRLRPDEAPKPAQRCRRTALGHLACG